MMIIFSNKNEFAYVNGCNFLHFGVHLRAMSIPVKVLNVGYYK